MKERTYRTTTLANCHEVLNSPDLIIDDPDGYQEHAISQQLIEQVEPNVSLVINREFDNAEPFLPKSSGGLEYGRMLNRTD
jgi:hypothetical protein